MSYPRIMIYFDKAIENQYRSRLGEIFGPGYKVGFDKIVELVETDKYIHPNALAMTNCKDMIIIRPREKLPYGLRNFILKHEKEHIIDPSTDDEALINRRVLDPSREYMRSRIKLISRN